MKARPSVVVFFSFFRRIREISSSRPLRRRRRLLLHRLLLLLLLLPLGFVPAREPRPKPNETKHGSLLFAPPPSTRSVVHTHAYTCVRTYVYATRSHARSLSLAPALLRLDRARFHPRVLPFSSLLASSSANDRVKSLSPSSSNSISPLDRLSTHRPSHSLPLAPASLPCRFCASRALSPRYVGPSLSLSLSLALALSRSNNLSTRWVDVGSGRRFSLSHPIDRPFLHRYSPAAWRGCVRGREHGSRYNGWPSRRDARAAAPERT